MNVVFKFYIKKTLYKYNVLVFNHPIIILVKPIFSGHGAPLEISQFYRATIQTKRSSSDKLNFLIKK
jgi:hypothetical protein